MKKKFLKFPVEFKVDDNDSNIVTGYASVFDVVDHGGDRVVRGAFKKTISERIPAGKVKFLAGHGWELKDVLGTVVTASEDDHGLFFKAKLSSAQDVQDIKTKMIEGHINELSIGYETVKYSYSQDEKIRDLEEIKLWEISAVMFGMNPYTSIESVKSYDDRISNLESKIEKLVSRPAEPEDNPLTDQEKHKPKPAEPEETPLTGTSLTEYELRAKQLEYELNLETK